MGFQTLVLPKTKHTNKNWDKKQQETEYLLSAREGQTTQNQM
jgi:hypothetical protein